MSTKNIADLKTQKDTLFPSTPGGTSSSSMRTQHEDELDSAFNRIDGKVPRVESTVTGDASAYTVTVDYPAAYTDEIPIMFKAASTNGGGTSFTAQINSLAALGVYGVDQAQIADGTLIAGRWYIMTWDTDADGSGTDGLVVLFASTVFSAGFSASTGAFDTITNQAGTGAPNFSQGLTSDRVTVQSTTNVAGVFRGVSARSQVLVQSTTSGTSDTDGLLLEIDGVAGYLWNQEATGTLILGAKNTTVAILGGATYDFDVTGTGYFSSTLEVAGIIESTAGMFTESIATASVLDSTNTNVKTFGASDKGMWAVHQHTAYDNSGMCSGTLCVDRAGNCLLVSAVGVGTVGAFTVSGSNLRCYQTTGTTLTVNTELTKIVAF